MFLPSGMPAFAAILAIDKRSSVRQRRGRPDLPACDQADPAPDPEGDSLQTDAADGYIFPWPRSPTLNDRNFAPPWRTFRGPRQIRTGTARARFRRAKIIARF
jgi:hypothetical protein